MLKITSHHSNLTLFITTTLGLMLFLNLFTAAAAQESIMRTAPSSFALSAVKEEQFKEGMRTAFRCPSPLPPQSVVPEQPVVQRTAVLPSRVTAVAAPAFRPPAAPVPTSGQVLPAQPQQPVVPQQGPCATRKAGTSDEYCVNWSPWMGVLAHRWFTSLQYAEEASGLRFHTARPALIQFTCYADGHIGNIVLKQSSGIPYYDRLQVATLLAAAPLPPFPPGTERKCLTLVQGWESHKKEAGDREFEPTAFAARFPQEKVSRWVTSHQ